MWKSGHLGDEIDQLRHDEYRWLEILVHVFYKNCRVHVRQPSTGYAGGVASSMDKVVRIRRNIHSYGDPYLREAKPREVAVCRECRSVYAGERWRLRSQAGRILRKAKGIEQTLCPACQKIHDRMPGGVVTLTGSFVRQHEEEIVNLLNNESGRTMSFNPLERIMDLKRSDDGLVVLTTNEKLAQRIGRALHKAYRGTVQYRWSEDTKLARVYWNRD